MIDILLNTLEKGANFLFNIIYYGVLLSYNIGNVLVAFNIFLFKEASTICKHVVELIHILYEDSFYFIVDLSQRCKIGILFIIEEINFVSETVSTCLNYIQNGLIYLNDSRIATTAEIFNTSLQIVNTGKQICVNIKEFIILFGKGIWFLIAFIPNTLIESFYFIDYIVKQCYENLCDFIAAVINQSVDTIINICDFIIDVPFESIAGIISGICIIYTLAKCHLIITNFCAKQFLQITRIIKTQLHQLYSAMRNHIQKRRIAGLLDTTNETDDEEEQNKTQRKLRRRRLKEERLCVICQERSKCILILPCKHVCLCEECSNQFNQYQQTCPICRTFINTRLKIYI